MRLLHALLLCAVAIGVLSVPAAGELVARWALEPTDLAVWDAYSVPGSPDQQESRRSRAHTLGLFGHQIDRRGLAGFPVTRLEEIPYDLALQVPVRAVEEGDAFRRTVRYEDIRDHLPLQVLLVGRVMEARHGLIVVEGELQETPPIPFDPRDHPEGRHRVTRLRGTFSTTFDVEKGLMTASRVVVETTTEHRDNDAQLGRPPPPTENRHAWRFALRRTRACETRRLAPAVGAAIDRGVAWLQGRINEEGTFGSYGADYHHGETCIAILTLLVCGADRQDPVVVRLMETIRGWPPRKTYEVGLALMAMEAYHAPADEAVAIHEGRMRSPAPRRLSDADRAWVQERVDWLLAGRKKDPRGATWSYDHGATSFDNSNTQYAVLGLLSAWRCGAAISETTWVDVARWFINAQEDRGVKRTLILERASDRRERTAAGHRVEARGFPYRVGDKNEKGEIYGSMTTGGVASLCIARDVLRLLRSRHIGGTLGKNLDRAIRDGWGWLAEHWCIQRHPVTRGADWYHYYMYGLERAGVLGGVRALDGHDWYAEGSAWLIDTQEEDGHWALESGNVHSTCFALLFLRRGTIPVTTGD